MPDPVADAAWATAHALADRARRIARRCARRSLEVDHKPDASPVTDADRAIESLCREEIARRHPDHGVVGEEFGSVRAHADWVWVIDPIDGTRAFVGGFPTWATLIALLHRGIPVLGLIDAGATGERFTARRGGPALHEAPRRPARPCRVSGCTDLRHARIATGVPDDLRGAEAAACARLGAAAAAHCWGGDAYAYGLLARGRLDLIVEAGLDAHDFLAPAAVVEAAGGVISDLSGRPLGLGGPCTVVAAATPALHARAIDEWRRAAG